MCIDIWAPNINSLIFTIFFLFCLFVFHALIALLDERQFLLSDLITLTSVQTLIPRSQLFGPD